MRILRTFFIAVLFSPALSAAASGAETLRCEARFDESSVYHLEAALDADRVSGPVRLRYVTEDGLDLATEMKATGFRRVGEVLMLKARNDSMGLALDAVEMGSPERIVGRLSVSFSLDHAEPVELDATCAMVPRYFW